MAWMRRNVSDIIDDPADETLRWYGATVGVMRNRPLSDGRSWMFQAAVHGHPGWRNPPPPWSNVPAPIRETFWNQCQHGTWFFLPWHRMYLGFFEQIVRAEIVRQGGPEDWALPYWDYNSGDDSRLLPPPFRPRLVDGEPNPLFVEARILAANEGGQFMRPRDVDLAGMLEARRFSTPPGVTGVSFAGPETLAIHFGPGPGALEDRPHNFVHDRIGGWMGDANTAALDPIFWLHHANVDRLWEAWLNASPEHRNGAQAAWTGDVRFAFRDANDDRQDLVVGDVLDPSASRFAYSYDIAHVELPARAALQPAHVAMAPHDPELTAASQTGIALGNDPVHVSLRREERAHRASRSSTAATSRLYLSFEQITSDEQAGIYDVYINVPDGEDPAQHEDRCVGSLALFGVEKASDPKGPHGGGGMTRTLDISKNAAAVGLLGAGDEGPDFKVSLVRSGTPLDANVRIGRIGLYEA